MVMYDEVFRSFIATAVIRKQYVVIDSMQLLDRYNKM